MKLLVKPLRELARMCTMSGAMANVTAEELTELLDAYDLYQAWSCRCASYKDHLQRLAIEGQENIRCARQQVVTAAVALLHDKYGIDLDGFARQLQEMLPPDVDLHANCSLNKPCGPRCPSSVGDKR